MKHDDRHTSHTGYPERFVWWTSAHFGYVGYGLSERLGGD
jgi:hypothetical protein